MRFRLEQTGDVGLAARRAVRPQLEELGNEILRDIKLHCPVRTGKLRDSFEAVVTDDNLTVGSDVEYAPFVSDGTSEEHGNPFFKNAVTQRRVVSR